MMLQLIKPLTLALVAALAFGQLGRLPEITPGINVYAFDVLAMLLLLAWLPGAKVRLDGLKRAALYFALVALMSFLAVRPEHEFYAWLASGAYLARWFLYFGLYLIYTDPRVLKLKLPLKKYLTNLALALGGIGLLQYLILPDTRFLAFSNWDDHYFRVIGSLGDPSFLGLMLLLGLIISRKWLLLIPLFLTYSRSTYLAGLAVLATAAWFKRAWRFLAIGLLALAVVLPLLPRPGGEGVNLLRWFSVEQRWDNYTEGFNLWRQSPLLGVGFNTLRAIRGDYVSHAASGLDNSFLFVAATTGIIGLLFYLNLLRRLWQNGGEIVKLSLVAVIVHSFFQNSLFYPLVMIWLWLLLASNQQD